MQEAREVAEKYDAPEVEAGTQILVLGTDPHADVDDSAAAVLGQFYMTQLIVTLSTLLGIAVKRAVAKILGYIVNIEPVAIRAAQMKNLLFNLGFGDIPVGVGSAMHHQKSAPACIINELAVKRGEMLGIEQDGIEMAGKILANAKDKSVTILIISSPHDCLLVMKEYPREFARAVKAIYFMGSTDFYERLHGAGHVHNGMVELDEDWNPKVPHELLFEEDGTPKSSAQNVKYAIKSAVAVFSKAREWGIPLTVLDKTAALACQVTKREYYDAMANTSDVGAGLARLQALALQALYEDSYNLEKVRMPLDVFIKRFLAEKYQISLTDEQKAITDKAKKLEVIIEAAKAVGLAPDTQIWECLDENRKIFALYDLLTTMAACKDEFAQWIVPRQIEGLWGLYLIGKDEIHNPDELAELMVQLTLRGLRTLRERYLEINFA